MQLPNADNAVVSQDKVAGYLLNVNHPEGAGKAVFFSSLGFESTNWRLLADALRRHGQRHAVAKRVVSPHGVKYVVDGVLETPGNRDVIVRTVWIVDLGEEVPRFVTAYPLEGVE
jgi:hypothetical protein